VVDSELIIQLGPIEYRTNLTNPLIWLDGKPFDLTNSGFPPSEGWMFDLFADDACDFPTRIDLDR